jgi:hypothetical protein
MNRSDLDTLLQGALDHTLTPGEQARLTRMLTESAAARDRAAELDQLAALLASLGPADAPPGLAQNVLAEISHRPHVVRPSTFSRGIIVNKKILFGLAAAAVIVLAVITYNSYPPVTVGTEATIGAAQRAQTPQIAAQDVKLGDTSSQDVLQTDVFDAIMKDAALRNMLKDANLRAQLQDAQLRQSLSDANIRQALADPQLASKIQDQALVRALDSAELKQQLKDTSLRALLSNQAFAAALRNSEFRAQLANGAGAALASAAFQSALRDPGFAAALQSPQFAEAGAMRPGR